MAFDIITFGSLIVEIMRKDLDRELSEPAEFVGPYASGDTPIFINAAARLGAKTAMIGAVGKDDFGRCVIEKLAEANVDMTFVQQNEGLYTGSTFVMYYSDGSRKFMYHLNGSGSTTLDPNAFTPEYLRGAKWVHYTGFTLESGKCYRDAVYRSLEMLDPETKVSFDPNLRGIFTPEETRKMCQPILDRANVILPSGEEAKLFTQATDEEEGCRILTDGGKKMVVFKRGSKGSRFYVNGDVIDVAPFKVTEIDPTGAGDTFAAALLTALIEGKPIEEAGRFANAAGAFAVSKRGPMEGAAWRRDVDAFLASGLTDLDSFLKG